MAQGRHPTKSASPAARRFKTAPTKVGGVMIAFSVFFFMIGTNIASGWLLLMASLCIAAPIMSLFRSLTGGSGIEVERDEVCRGEVGGEMTYTMTARASRGRKSQIVITDPAVGSRPMVIESLGRHESARVAARALPLNRGIFVDPDVEVECAAPLGLWSTRRKMKCSGTFEIAPPFPPISVPWRAGGDDPLAEGLTEPPRRGVGLDFMGLREYRTGDPPKHIDWASSAKRDDLIVREYQQEGVRPLAVIADLRFAGPYTERAISIAGAITRDAITRSIPVWLAIPTKSGAEIIESPHVGVLRAELARAETPGAPVDLAGLLADRRLPPNPLCIFVSPIEAVGSLPSGGSHFVNVVIGEPDSGPSPYPIWWCPLEGDACLIASSTASAA